LTGAPGRRADEDVDRAGVIERREAICVVREALEALVRMLSPFAPHTAEEIWERLGHAQPIAEAAWPAFNPEVAKAEEVVLVVQVDGKVRDRLTVAAGVSEDAARSAALASEKVQERLRGREVVKVIVVPGRLVSIVTRAAAS